LLRRVNGKRIAHQSAWALCCAKGGHDGRSAKNRLFIVLMIILTMKAIGVSRARFEAPLGQLFNITSPFDEIANALQ
jgi:hypothetical protein